MDSSQYISGFSKQGAKAWQEDSYLTYIRNINNNILYIGGVFDGHGGFNGLLSSLNCKNVIINYFNNFNLSCINWTKDEWNIKMKELFLLLHNNLRDNLVANKFDGIDNNSPEIGRYCDDKGVVRQANGDPIHGGTTASIVVVLKRIDGSRLIVSANVGDTDVIIFSKSTDWRRLSEDHGPDSESEWERINKTDSHLYPTKLLFIYDKTNVYRKCLCPLVFLENGKKDPIYTNNP